MTEHSAFTEAQRQELKKLVAEAMTEYFEGTGKMTKNFLITAATIIGALVVIFGGVKALLGWLGFIYIKP